MKTKCLLYCTKGTPKTQLIDNRTINNKFELCWCLKNDKEQLKEHIVNGKIVAECEVECEEIKYHPYECTFYTETLNTIVSPSTPISSFEKASCLSYFELAEYLNKYETDIVCGYALHISNLKVFDRPRELCEFHQNIKKEPPKELLCSKCGKPMEYYEYKYLTKAPQNMMWVWYKGERYCLISIRPQWICKELNGEKPVEVRKQILKGMK